ncbi:cell division protein PerM [Arthrobacter sp. MDT3-44]
MKLPTKPRALPMPLWLQGVLELGQSAVISALLVAVPVAAVWLTGGFADRVPESAARLAGQAWLVMHGVPLVLRFPAGVAGADAVSGLLHVLPLGLILVPLLLAWRAGRRLARASYTDQLWQAFLGAMVAYAAIGAAVAHVSTTADAAAPLAAGALIPPVSAAIGLITGAYREAGAWSRLVGVDFAAWVGRTSQHSRWAGSYAWSVLRSGFLAVMVAVCLSAVLLAVAIGLNWAGIAAIYERIDGGIAGASMVTLFQLGLLPNLAVWTMAWSTGAGFALGTGSSLTPLTSTVGPLPALPILGALPAGTLDYGYAALAIPVVAGLLAGWWFFRDGENHFDEWLVLRSSHRWLTATASTLALAGLIGIAAGLGGVVVALISRASLGLGRFTDLGPDPLTVGLWLALEVAVGAVLGHAVGPLLEREPRRR